MELNKGYRNIAFKASFSLATVFIYFCAVVHSFLNAILDKSLYWFQILISFNHLSEHGSHSFPGLLF